MPVVPHNLIRAHESGRDGSFRQRVSSRCDRAMHRRDKISRVSTLTREP